MEREFRRFSFVEQLKPFAPDAEAYGRTWADLHDVYEICEWFVAEMNDKEGKKLSPDEIQQFLIDIDIKLITHAMFHFRSLRRDADKMLANIPDDEHHP